MRNKLKSGYAGILNGINVLIGLLLLISILFLSRDVVSLSYKKVEDPNPSFNPGSQVVEKKDLQVYEAILKNNPFGFSAGSLKPYIRETI